MRIVRRGRLLRMRNDETIGTLRPRLPEVGMVVRARHKTNPPAGKLRCSLALRDRTRR